MKTKLCICIILFNFTLTIQAQNTFEKTYGSSAYEKAKSVRQTSDGGYIIGGTNLVRVDSMGVEQWTKSYPSTFTNTTNQGYILINSNSQTITFTKINLNGDIVWQTNYSQGIWANHGKYIEQAEDGGYIVAGNYQDVTGSGMLLLKLDSLGNKLWKRTFSEPTSAAFCHGFSTQQTNDNGYIIAGYTYINYYDSTRHKDVFIVKTDSLGSEQWRRYFGGTMDDLGSFVRQDNQGNYFIAATTSSYSNGTESDMYLIKLDSLGDSLWTQTYGGNLKETATGLWPTNDGGCILVGQSNSFSNGDFNGYIVKTDENGDTLWTKNYGGAGVEVINSVQQTADNGYVMAGYTNSIGAGDFDMFLLKTDSLGNYTLNTGINKNSISILDFYPNPTKGIFYIQSQLKISKVEIINLVGETIYFLKLNNNKAKIDLKKEAKGIYFYQIYIGENKIVQSGKIVLE
tara:strand:- start:560 stop:1930 length:1371 start_codon:yes stop_codon:yes gene_type:complete